jgi:hypothetical protein|tara:strand:+ start:294 stop:563 length:270 start_codon:yes stop_codon:yes gene_type:complete
MKCCGKEVETHFCPECGTEVYGDPLGQLIAHVKGLLNKQKAAKRRGELWDKENPDDADHYQRRARRAKVARNIVKYEQWLAYLTKGNNK